MRIESLSLSSKDPNRKSERTKEIRGFITYEAKKLSGELSHNEKLFLQILKKRIQKRVKGFRAMNIKLKSFNIIFD